MRMIITRAMIIMTTIMVDTIVAMVMGTATITTTARDTITRPVMPGCSTTEPIRPGSALPA